MDYDHMNRVVRRHKAALTRAKKKGPAAVIAACDAAFAAFDEPDMYWPDNWHLWNIAKLDAENELARAGGAWPT